jgi:hypothetical protein
MAELPTDDRETATEGSAHKRVPREGEVKKVTGELEQKAAEKQRAAHDSQRKWLNGMQDELKKGER